MTDVRVEVPGQHYMGPTDQAAWEAVGALVGTLQRAIGSDMAFSLVLSRVTREMRRAYGTENAKAVLQGFLDTWTDRNDLG